MGDYLKIDASMVSYVGITDSAGTGSYYINGKYTCRPPINNMNISVESIRDTQLFAVSEGMENENSDRNIPISLVENIHRYYQKNAENVDDIEEALDDLYEIVEDIYDKVKEQPLSEAFSSGEASLAAILMHENSAGIIRLGSSKIYLVRNGSLKLLDEDSRNTDQANKTDDFEDEQEEISIDGENISEESQVPLKSNSFEIRPGDTFLLSSNNLIDYLDEEALLYIMSLDGDSAYMSVTAMDEVLKRQRKQDILIQVIKVDEIKGSREHRVISRSSQRSAVRTAAAAAFEAPAGGASAAREFTGRMPSKSISRKVKRALKLILSTVIIFAVVFGIFMGLQRLLFGPPENGGGESTPITASKPTTTQKPTTSAAPTTGDGGTTTTAAPTTTASPTTTAQPTTTARPTTTAGSTTAYTGNYQEYTVKKGDTLSSISRQFYGDTSKINLIMQANNITNADMIEIGTVLKIPVLN